MKSKSFLTFKLQLSICFLVFCFLSCKAQQPQIMTFEKNIDTIRIQKEAAFVIQLESSYGNGYEWQLREPLNVDLLQLDSTSVTRPKDYTPKTDMEENEKIWERFHFRAVEKGTMMLHFDQVRAWQKSSVQDSTMFRIIVE